MFAALTKWLPEARKMNSNLLIVPGSSIIDFSCSGTGSLLSLASRCPSANARVSAG